MSLDAPTVRMAFAPGEVLTRDEVAFRLGVPERYKASRIRLMGILGYLVRDGYLARDGNAFRRREEEET